MADKNKEVKKEELTSAEKINGFFDPIPDKEPIIVGIAGFGGLGKTHLANTFPNPIIADTEGRAQIVMKKFDKNRHRKVVSNIGEVRDTLLITKTDICPDFANRSNYTFVIDSGSNLLQYAETEWLAEAKKDKVYPLVLWAKVYDKVDFIFNKIRQFGLNAVVTQRLKEEYKGEKPTGEFIPEGYKKLPYIVDIYLQFQKGIEFEGDIYYPEIVVAEVIKDCWHKAEYTKPYLIDVSYDGIFNELKEYKHPAPGNKDEAVKLILKELEKKTGIPIAKAKASKK